MARTANSNFSPLYPSSIKFTITKPIGKSQLHLPEPKRLRDEAHLKFVASQPCMVCDRQPAHAHHLHGLFKGGRQLAYLKVVLLYIIFTLDCVFAKRTYEYFRQKFATNAPIEDNRLVTPFLHYFGHERTTTAMSLPSARSVLACLWRER